MYTCINCTLLYLCTVIAQYIYIVIYIFTEYIYIHILYTLSEIVIDYCGAEKHLPCVCVLILSIVLALHLCLRLSRRIHLYVCAYQSTRVPACRRVYTAFSTLCSQLIGLLLASVCAILSRMHVFLLLSRVSEAQPHAYIVCPNTDTACCDKNTLTLLKIMSG